MVQVVLPSASKACCWLLQHPLLAERSQLARAPLGRRQEKIEEL